MNIECIKIIYDNNKSSETDKYDFLVSLIKYLHFSGDNKVKLLDFYFENNGDINTKIYNKINKYITDDFDKSIIQNYLASKSVIK